jgi:hypothetical protein
MNKLKPGQKLYREIGNQIFECEVEFIGNKYFYIKGLSHNRHRFFIETLRRDPDHTGGSYLLYISKQEIIDEKEKNNLANKIKLITFLALSLDQLQRIKTIIEESKCPAKE